MDTAISRGEIICVRKCIRLYRISYYRKEHSNDQKKLITKKISLARVSVIKKTLFEVKMLYVCRDSHATSSKEIALNT